MHYTKICYNKSIRHLRPHLEGFFIYKEKHMPIPQGNPGLSGPVQQAFARRAGGEPQAQAGQVSPGVPGGQQMPPPMPPSQVSAPSQGVPQQQQKFEPQSRQDLIILSLIEQLKLDNAAEKQAVEMSQPAPQGGGMNGGSYGPAGVGGGEGMAMGNRVMGTSSSPMNQQSDYYGSGMKYAGGGDSYSSR